MQALRDALAKALATLPLESRQGQKNVWRSPRIYLGQLPPRQANAPFEAPFVLIQALGGHEDEEGFARAEIALRVCVWGGEGAAEAGAGTRLAAQRSAASVTPLASDPECRTGRATEGYPGEGCENDLHNLLATIRHALMGYRNTALNGRYILDKDSSGWLPWTRPDEQAPGFAEAYILSQWKMQGYC